ncbi:MAG: signal peptidase I [Cyanobacteria bacterium P01_E01_bin.42]
MSKNRDRWLRYGLLALIALAFVLYPYFVNQMPELAFLKSIPAIWVFFGALFFAAIVLVGPELLNSDKLSEEELLEDFWRENQKIIQDRLKSAFDRHNYIAPSREEIPKDLRSPNKKTSWWDRLFRRKQWITTGGDRENCFWRFDTRREVEDLPTGRRSPLAANKTILEVFEDAKRRLLILGEPGSGKTTELLQLAKDLSEKAEDSRSPIPVIFELSAWRGEPMLDWMAAQLHGRYGLKLATCREWLRRDKVVPLLDGLDELGKGRIRDAIAAIDALQKDYQQQPDLVICCRIQDYREAIAEEKEGSETRYHLRGVDRAVRLCELNESQIRHYLQQRDAENLWEDLQVRSGFWELAKNPMFLNLMPIAYPERLPENAPEDPKTCQSLLFNAFLHRKLNPSQRSQSGQLEDYKPDEARKYLAWLAASMEREGINQREFLIEKLQPTWLESQQQRQRYQMIQGIIFGLIFGGIFGLTVGIMFGLILGGIFGLIFGIIESDKIELTEALDLSWIGIKRGIRQGLILGLIFGLIGVLSGVLTVGLIRVPIFRWIGGIMCGLILGIIFGLIGGIKAELKVRTKSNQGIWETAIKILITISLATLLSPLIVLVPIWVTGRAINWLEAVIQGGGFGILIGFLAGGGIALVQHFALRWALVNERKIPWNYTKFLGEASNINILRKSGGSYRFYHDKLRKYLARENNIAYNKICQPKKQYLRQSAITIIVILVLLGLLSGMGAIFEDSNENISLYPILQAKDTIWIDRITYRFRSIQRYHIVDFTASESLRKQGFTSNSTYLRRIIALPDETLEIRQGRIFIDDELLEDADIKMPKNFKRSRITLDSDEYYVIGNNPDYTDLETFGAIVSRQDIRGQVIMRIYPFDRMGLIR